MHVTKSAAAGVAGQPEEIDSHAEVPEYVKKLVPVSRHQVLF